MLVISNAWTPHVLAAVGGRAKAADVHAYAGPVARRRWRAGPGGDPPPAYGKEYATAIPGAEFHLVRDAGHLPQIEAPEALLALVGQFAGADLG